MRDRVRVLGLAGMLLMTATAFSCQRPEQESIGGGDEDGPGVSVTGLVSDHTGAAVSNAPIQAKNRETGTAARTRSAADGRFTLSGLAPGVYELSLTMPCCAFKPFVGDGVRIDGGNSQRFDIQLEQDDNFVTVGLHDDPGLLAAAVRSQIPTMPTEPAPETTDGNPDLSGVWLVSEDPFPEPPRPLPEAAALAEQRAADSWGGHPHARCLPWGMPVPYGVGPALAKFVQTQSLLVILFEDTPGFRQVFLDGRGHPANADPTWMGHSVGRWDGESLVVDSTGFNDRAWLLAYPRTEGLHVTERYTRVDLAHLEAQVTIEDPTVFQEPWVANMTWELAPQEEVLEFVCENNRFVATVSSD